MIRPSVAVLAALAILHSTSGSAAVQTADEIVEKHLAALGGRAALGKLTSRRATGTVTLSTQAGDIPGTVELSAKPISARPAR
jgi:hypothetical protein